MKMQGPVKKRDFKPVTAEHESKRALHLRDRLSCRNNPCQSRRTPEPVGNDSTPMQEQELSANVYLF